MSVESKRASDAIKPVLAQSLSASMYAGLLAIPGIGPFFALPIISHLSKYFIGRLSDYLISETAVGLSLLWIMIDLQYEVKNSEDMKKKLKDMLENPQKYTEKEQKKIEEDFDDSTVDLIRLTISRL